MRRQKLFIGTCLVVALVAVSGWAQPLVRVTFNDGTAGDSSGNGHDGQLLGSAAVVADAERGQVMKVDASGMQVEGPLDMATSFTLSAWAKFDIPKASGRFLFGGPWQFRTDDEAGSGHVYVEIRYPGGTFKNKADTRTPDNPDGQLDGLWHHYALTLTDDGIFSLYFDGVEAPYRNPKEGWTAGHDFGGALGPLFFGTENESGGSAIQGYMDNIQVYNYAVPAEEIAGLFLEGGSTEQAASPVPSDGSSDVISDVALSWKPGEFAQTHTVYLSKNLDDVNDASAVALVAEHLDVNTLLPGSLDFGATYFWRVDEVNGAPDYSVFHGSIWSFEVEPYSIAIPGSAIQATASSESENGVSFAEKTVDGSGLEGDTHGVQLETMWFTATPDLDPWIQYEFDGVKKLDTMKVWNSNGLAESSIGWGVKAVDISTSVDGVNWRVLEDVNEFSRAPGTPAYDQFDVIAFHGIVAKYVRLNIKSNWGGVIRSYSLSEVQFFMIPTQARTPVPASGSVDVRPDTVITWREGRDADHHIVSIDADQNTLAEGSAISVTAMTNHIDLGSLDVELGETYYWRVDEVNDAEAVSLWTGPVWSFSTTEAVVVDDFESYSNLSPNRPFQTWLDGFGYSADEFFPVEYPGNGTGSGVGHDIWGPSSPYFDGS
ncbi:MAG: discoidin domain-containing protein, partial [Phycisphaerae bacterium]|nr:discoidin domain-containing protein [Phycisphaerae bacterium]